MDYESVAPDRFGQALSGIGVNLVSRDVRALAGFLAGVFGLTVHRLSNDFAIVTGSGGILMLHADATFAAHPLLSLLPEAGARGAGVEIRLYETDPDAAAARATVRADATLLQPPADKPHGLRECVILSAEGYAFVPSRRIAPVAG